MIIFVWPMILTAHFCCNMPFGGKSNPFKSQFFQLSFSNGMSCCCQFYGFPFFQETLWPPPREQGTPQFTFGGIDCLVSFRFDDPTRTEKTPKQVVPRISEFVLLWLFVAFGFLTHQYLGLKFGMFFKEAQKLLCTKNHGAAWCSNMFFKHFQTDHVQTDHPSIANIPAFLVGSWTNPFEKICNRQIGSWNPKDREGQGRDGYSYISGYIFRNFEGMKSHRPFFVAGEVATQTNYTLLFFFGGGGVVRTNPQKKLIGKTGHP